MLLQRVGTGARWLESANCIRDPCVYMCVLNVLELCTFIGEELVF
jgi:hypothetical protein